MSKYMLPRFGIDISLCGKAHRKIRHAFRGASRELECLAMSLAEASRDGKLLVVPTSQAYCKPEGISRVRLKAAVEELVGGGIMALARHYRGGAVGGWPNAYAATARFREVLNFRVPDQWPVTENELNRPVIVGGESPSVDIQDTDRTIDVYHYWTNLNSITVLSRYSQMAAEATLFLSNDHQVRPHIDIYRVDGLRLYARGTYNFQNDIRKEWRSHLLIDGEPTVELDYSAMHANIVLNWEGFPSDASVYETVLDGLGLKPLKAKRSAMKLAVLAAFNSGDFDSFRSASNDARDGKSISKAIGRTPQQVLDSMLTAYPAFARYVCQDNDLWRRLQLADSDIMVDILSALSDVGVLALPLHDSVIAPVKHADAVKQVMSECYLRKMGFEPAIK